jgi:hypothetical protein
MNRVQDPTSTSLKTVLNWNVINNYAKLSAGGKVGLRKKGFKTDRRRSIKHSRRQSKRIVLSNAPTVKPDDLEVFSDDKRKALRTLEARLRKSLVKVGNYRFSFKFRLQDFARANKLPISKAAEIFPQVLKEAEERWYITKMRLMKATPLGHYETEAKTGKSRVVWSLTFRSFLPTVEDQPWHDFFKPLRLNPVSHEVEEVRETPETEEGDSAFSTSAHLEN